jgi:hypothetical protein
VTGRPIYTSVYDEIKAAWKEGDGERGAAEYEKAQGKKRILISPCSLVLR